MHQKKRILYIGNKLAKHDASPTTADWLPNALRHEGHDVIAVSEQKNIPVRMLDMIFTTFNKRKSVDVVIIDTYSTLNFYYATIIGTICRFYNLPYIPLLHGGDLPRRLMENKRMSGHFFKGAKIIVAPSMYLYDAFKKRGFDNLTYIPNTIEIENYTFLERKRVSPNLMWVRSFSEIYNPLLALEIIEILLKRDLKPTLCMVGPDKDGSLVRCQKIAKDLKLPITFTGLLTKKEWVDLSKEYDVFLNTSKFDNMPVSVMEAMALGLPVISTNVGGMSSLITDGKTGRLIPPNSALGFADAIEDLLENADKAKSMARNARLEMEKLDWQLLKEKWEILLGNI